MSNPPLITLLTFLPLIGGLVVIGLKPGNALAGRRIALCFSLASLVLACVLRAGFDTNFVGIQLGERHEWIQALSVQYHVGVDGLGLLMVMLTGIVVPLSLMASSDIKERVPLYCGLVLFLQTGLYGTFTALDFFHWFLFWELSLVPAFFLIRLWGGPQRASAATRFFVYTMVGSIALLLSILAVYLAAGTFDFLRLGEMARDGSLSQMLAAKLAWTGLNAYQLALLVFAGAFLGFAVKVPLVPFHSWLPLAYAEAPSSTTMLLTGLMSKMGVYGFLRILVPIFPEQMRSLQTPLLWLAVLTIVFSAGAAFAQRDLKRIFAFSSINHLGYCLLGVFAVAAGANSAGAMTVHQEAAVSGVMLQMFNHGLTAAVLFWFVVILEQRSGGLRGIDDFGGLRKAAPVLCGFMGIALFSSLGLPGLNGFVSEFLIFRGVFPLAGWAAALSLLGLLITAVFLLTLMQRVFHGPLNEKWSGFQDLTTWERALLAPPLLLMLLLGVWPQLALGVLSTTVIQLASWFK